MAQIVLGMWTSHGPTLSTTPEQWMARIKADRGRQHPFRLGEYSFDQLVELRKEENLARQCSLEERTRRHAACQAAMKVMADEFAQVAPDVCVILGNDQNEIFLEDVRPALTVYCGETFYNEPTAPEKVHLMAPGIHEAEAGHNPPQYTEYPGHPQLAEHILKTAMAAQFDVAYSKKLPQHPAHWSSGIPHAFGFIYRMIMRDQVVPNVPIISNTFFPPNQPTAKRLFEFGRIVGQAIRAWPSNQRVAVFGSGGMSHFVIDEQFDAMILKALRERDAKTLTSIDERYFQAGTSELKNWIAAAGVMFDTELRGDVVDYIPCYRSEAGTGTANGFVYWS